MYRRQLLRAAGGGVAVPLAGCAAALVDDSPDEVVLPPQEDEWADNDNLPFLSYGDQFPEFSLPDPIADTTVDTATLDRIAIVTAFFAWCPAECVLLMSQLAAVQHRTIESGLTDDTVFLAVTFDPNRDDEAALRENAEMNRVDLDAGNWHYLRPSDNEAAAELVEGEFGIAVEQTDDSERMESYDFIHHTLTFLVNPDGYVERTYRTDQPDIDRLVDDIEQVVSSFE